MVYDLYSDDPIQGNKKSDTNDNFDQNTNTDKAFILDEENLYRGSTDIGVPVINDSHKEQEGIVFPKMMDDNIDSENFEKLNTVPLLFGNSNTHDHYGQGNNIRGVITLILYFTIN